MKSVAATPRLVALPAGGMCQYNVILSTVAGVDAELAGSLPQAFYSAG